MIRIDLDRQWQTLSDASILKGAIPRQTRYGESVDAIPYGDVVDQLIDPKDYKEVIERCHTEHLFPMYHQKASWAPEGFVWNQNGLKYCWAWSLVASLMDVRAREGKSTVLLAPITLGHLVGWRNRGNYLENAIHGLKEVGVSSQSFVPNQHLSNPRSFKEGWKEDRTNYRLGEVWDCDNTSTQSMIQHCTTILSTGTPLYVGYDWWGHAVECVGLEWDESVKNNLIWKIRNSHGENELLELTGRRAVPDEAFGIRSSITNV